MCCNCPSTIPRSFGEIIAVSLAQGGPAPDFMRNWCYSYLATGDFDRLVVTPDDVTDRKTIQLLEKVQYCNIISMCSVKMIFIYIIHFAFSRRSHTSFVESYSMKSEYTLSQLDFVLFLRNIGA